jgi:chemotaxis regulatin CheY-phosphate phosphatase CheZ
MNGTVSIDVLKRELQGLFNHIQKIRSEIASIHIPDDPFSNMSDQLEAIVKATESATHDIMQNVEEIEGFSLKLREVSPENTDLCENIEFNVANAIVACSFQDLTGQRVTKVVKLLKHIEHQINVLISMWGEDAIEKEKKSENIEPDEYKKYLNGPQLEGLGLEQTEIDKLISGQASKEEVEKIEEEKLAAFLKEKEAKKAQSEKKAQAQTSALGPVTSASIASAETPALTPSPTPAPKTSESGDDAEPLDQNAIDSLFN